MKITALLSVLLVAFSFMGMAQQWHGITSDSPVKMKKTLLSSTDDEIVVKIAIDGFYTQNVRTSEGKQVVIHVDEMASMLEAGAPDLPMGAVPVIIGDQAEMKVNVVNAEYVDYKDFEIAPSKGNLSRQINPDDVPFTYGEMYSQDAFWPATPAYVEAPYIMRDFRGQNIMVRPFAYNPVTKTLRVFTNMTIAMTKVSDTGLNPKAVRRSNTIKVDPEQKSHYEHRFLNFGETGSKYVFDEDFGELLIICADMYMSNMQPLVEWKNKSGRPTTLVSLSQVGGNDATNIKNYITSLYNDPSHNLEFILLVGEYNDLTPYVISSDKRSDNWFGKLEGNDDYLDALVGRLSVNSASDANAQVNKIIYYERDVQASASWTDKGMGIGYYGAGSGHYGEDDYLHIDLIRDTLLHYTYTQVTEHHGGSGGDASSSTISGTINQGVGIINYCNHGSVTSWGVANYSTSDVAALTNDGKLPVVWSVACLNGQFDTGTCFGESWLRATNNSTGAPTGAVGGMFSWISQPWIPPMYGQDEMVDILTEWRSVDQFNHTLGGASLNGSMDILDKAPGDSYQTFNTWLLFGDPSLMMRTAVPTVMDVNANPSTLMIGMSSLDVHADVDYGIATLSMNGNIIACGKIVNGNCTLSFPALSNVGTADLVVMGYNKVTYIGTINIVAAEGAYIVLDGYTPTNVPVVEEQHLSLTLKNVGVEATTGTTNVVLSSDNPAIIFTDATGSFGVLGPDQTVTLTDEFAFTVAAGVPDNTMIQINFVATNGSDQWTGVMNITVGAPVIEFVMMEGGNGFEPGESKTVTAVFRNVGHYHATNAVVTASTSNSHVTITDATIPIGEIGVGEEAEAVFEVMIDSECSATAAIPLTFVLTADNGVEATGEANMMNSCNVVFSLHDSYGDGWNGNKLTVAYSDGTPSEELTISSGSSETFIREIGVGVTVVLGWISGNYTSECSFTVAYEDGDEITSASGLSANYSFQFIVNCSNITYEVTATANPSEAGTIEGAGTYHEGSICTLKVVPDVAYSFLNWTRDGEVVSTNAIYSFMVMEDVDLVANFGPFQGVVIGSGTDADDKLPSYSFYKYGMSEQIYTAEEVGRPGVITSIAFYNTGAVKTRSYDLYMIHTDKNSFASTSDWVAVTASDLVFRGTVTFTLNTWTTIYLDTPFEYNGLQNLLIVIDDNSGDYTSAPHLTCRVFNADGNQAMMSYSDSIDYDPTAPSSAGTVNLKTVKNQIRMEMESAGTFEITVSADDMEGCGIVDGGGTYSFGETCTVTAELSDNCADIYFYFWIENGEIVSYDMEYTFTVTSNRDLVAVFAIDNVNENTGDGLVVYPNPAHDKVYVEGENIASVELYNAMGQKLLTVKGEEKTEIDIATFGRGVYFIKVIGKDTRTKKIIVQ